MRTAVVLSGQPRYIDNGPNIVQSIIEPNNADVYAHIWKPFTDKPYKAGEGWKNERLRSDSIDQINFWYKPKKMVVQEQIDFPITNIDFAKSLSLGYAGGAEKKEIADYFIFATYSMWYSIKCAIELIEEDYDAIILSRLNLTFGKPIVSKNYDLNKVWSEPINPNLILNWMNFSNQKNMNIVFKDMYDKIDSIYNETGIWCNEYWVKYVCDNSNIESGYDRFGLYVPCKNL